MKRKRRGKRKGRVKRGDEKGKAGSEGGEVMNHKTEDKSVGEEEGSLFLYLAPIHRKQRK